ncbi:MAG: hypothetical protein LIP01_11040 [Tannerellaceae bacterium]|nr:hypothetical protein [Tannerellaceae bacterium]
MSTEINKENIEQLTSLNTAYNQHINILTQVEKQVSSTMKVMQSLGGTIKDLYTAVTALSTVK